jgi:glycosyltransferase involved in cell wall biosynthesis
MEVVLPSILHVIAGQPNGGIETYCMHTVQLLHDAGLSQQVVLKADAGREAALKAMGVPYFPVPFRLRGGIVDRQTRTTLRRMLHDFNPTIAQAWMNNAARALPKGDFLRVGWLRDHQNLPFYKGFDHLAGMTSGLVSAVVQQGWPEAQVHHIKPFVAQQMPVPIMRSQFATPEDAPLLLSVGRLHWHKGFDVLLEALEKLPNVWLWLVGEGEERYTLEQQAQRLGITERVRFLGWQQDIAALMNTATACVVPSRHEPFGLAILEAWTQHKPVLVSKSAASRIQVQDGVDALVFPVDDARGLMHAVEELLADAELAAMLAENGYAHYARTYTPALAVQQHLQVYQKMLKTGKNKSWLQRLWA